MRFLIVGVLLLLAACDNAPKLPAANMLTFDGLGPVRIGMTFAEAEAALGTKLVPWSPEDYEDRDCWDTWRADGQQAGVTYMMQDDKIMRVNVFRPTEDGQIPDVQSEKGIRIGATQQSVIDAYGAALKVMPHFYLGEDGSYLRIQSPTADRALLFETGNGTVATFRAGAVPHVDYVEGCL